MLRLNVDEIILYRKVQKHQFRKKMEILAPDPSIEQIAFLPDARPSRADTIGTPGARVLRRVMGGRRGRGCRA